VSFSGGKDSLVVLDLAERAGIRKAIFCDTTIEFPETLKYVDKIRGAFSLEIETVRAPVTFFDMVGRLEVPSRRLRWCCDVFKFGPIANYARRNGIHAFLTGLRNDESSRRSGYMVNDRNPMLPFGQINPIIDWSSDDVWDYINRYSLPSNPLYDKFDRVGCWCCPYRTNEDWEKIKAYMPEHVKEFDGVLERCGNNLGIKDMNEFVNERGWTRWAAPVRRVTGGLITPCQGFTKDTMDMIVNCTGQDEMKKILALLPILTDDFLVVGKRIRITIPKSKKKRLSILLEKAMRCVGCGACTSLCKDGALQVREGILHFDRRLCHHCEDCIHGRKLRGACVMRNYSSRKISYLYTEEEKGSASSLLSQLSST